MDSIEISLNKPVLALHISTRSLHGLLHIPGEPLRSAPRFVLPSPEAVFERRIRACTSAGRAVHIAGTPTGILWRSALADHITAGLPAAMHPASASGMGTDEKELGQCGITVAKHAAPESAALIMKDCSPDLWQNFLTGCGADHSVTILVSCSETGPLPCPTLQTEGCKKSVRSFRTAMLRAALTEAGSQGIAVQDLLFQRPPKNMPRLTAAHHITNASVADAGCGFALGFSALPRLRERSYREGLTFAAIGTTFARVALVFQERILGMLEYPLHTEADLPGFLHTLNDFRLGWLELERLEAHGGSAALLPDLPSEAEGFGPIYVSGKRASMLQQHGKITLLHPDPAMHECIGLLHAFSRMQ